MARQAALSDEDLRDYLSKGIPQTQIARLCHVSESAISQRVKKFETAVAAKAPQNVVRAVNSLWDIRAAAEENYARCIELLAECEGDPFNKRLAIAEIRQHLQFAMKILETLYAAQETQAFMDEVLNVLDECDPGKRKQILSRLAEKRTVRAAILPHE